VNRPLRAAFLPLALAVAVLFGGCSASVDEPNPTSKQATPDDHATATPAPELAEEGSLEYYEQRAALDDAVDDDQLDILRRAVEAQELLFEDYAQAIDYSLECITDAGIAIDGPDFDNGSGYPQLRYGFAAGSDASGGPDNPVPDECIRAHSLYVEMAYSSQPATQEILDKALQAKRPAVQACLEGAGVVVDNDLPIREWLLEVVMSGESGRDCINAQDITEF